MNLTNKTRISDKVEFRSAKYTVPHDSPATILLRTLNELKDKAVPYGPTLIALQDIDKLLNKYKRNTESAPSPRVVTKISTPPPPRVKNTGPHLIPLDHNMNHITPLKIKGRELKKKVSFEKLTRLPSKRKLHRNMKKKAEERKPQLHDPRPRTETADILNRYREKIQQFIGKRKKKVKPTTDFGIRIRATTPEELQQQTDVMENTPKTHMANSVLDAETGTQMEFRHLVKKDPVKWNRSFANEFGRLAQGIGNRVQGTDTIKFTAHTDVPRDAQVTYA
jgi:hypothetical protein